MSAKRAPGPTAKLPKPSYAKKPAKVQAKKPVKARVGVGGPAKTKVKGL